MIDSKDDNKDGNGVELISLNRRVIEDEWLLHELDHEEDDKEPETTTNKSPGTLMIMTMAGLLLSTCSSLTVCTLKVPAV